MNRDELQAVAANVRRADAEELLDRVTAFRAEMEPAALDLMEGELARRGFTHGDIQSHARDRQETAVVGDDGAARRCSFCDRPAVVRGWTWHRLCGKVPVFPWVYARCEEHAGW